MSICTIEGVSVSQLPPGGIGLKPQDFVESASGNPTPQIGSERTLEQFIREALTEAVPFIDGVAPKSGAPPTWKGKTSPTTFPESDAPVYSSEKSVLVKESGEAFGKERTETWFSRRSCHKDYAGKGTASWDEFSRAFYERHAETEKEFIPTVIEVRRAINWDTSGIEIELNGEKWTDISFAAWEMKHRIEPKPLSNRVFPTVQITAKLDGSQEFIIAQIPISNFADSPYSQYVKDKGIVVAAYTSAERLRILPNTGEVEWIMATASDAGGVLPQFVQNLAVPAEIAKDVKKFLSWILTQRS